MNATKTNAKKTAKALKPAVNTLLIATVFADAESKRVDAIQRAVLAEQNYTGSRDGEQIRITEPKLSYLMDEVSSAAYFARLNGIHLAEGFAAAADGHCPALTADSLKVDAEIALIEAAEKFFPGTTNNALCGAGMDKRRQYLDLLIKLVVNTPGYRSPLKAA